MRRLLFLAIACGPACGDPLCIEGVCKDPSERRSFPAPCAARGEFGEEGPDASRSIGSFMLEGSTITVKYEVSSWAGAWIEKWAIWERDAEGRWWPVEARVQDDSRAATWRWQYQADRVIEDVTVHKSFHELVDHAYDVTFGTLPANGTELAEPDGELGLIERRSRDGSTLIASYTWSIDGPRQIRDGSDGSRVVFTFDDRNRLVSRDDGDAIVEYEYENGLLVRAGETTYEYDLGGNLAERRRDADNYREVYDYSCRF